MVEDVKTYSNRYNNLESRLNDLENHYVSQLYEKSVIDLNPKELDMCRGYRVLCHAEVESYLEDRALELLNFSRSNWFQYKKISTSLLSLFAHYKFLDNPEINGYEEVSERNNNRKYMKLEEKIGKICADFKEEKIKMNHGLKQKNLINLLVPLGIDIFELDTAWLSTMDSFGSRRGETAHTSVHTQQPIDLTTEKNDLEIIKHGLKELDEIIDNMLKE
ncbi:HEPN domain-containing protein [Bacillus velezensis]|uniref:HEPN domain-containing protein n=1 Tax=Bacillus velezensis TaxID=492670 RepID=UPI002D76CDC7|nr:HEPN domain-containing protein [Bacillus velezensis]WRT00909.1 HEPN domain-containing protein [Bacillus velezensis]